MFPIGFLINHSKNSTNHNIGILNLMWQRNKIIEFFYWCVIIFIFDYLIHNFRFLLYKLNFLIYFRFNIISPIIVITILSIILFSILNDIFNFWWKYVSFIFVNNLLYSKFAADDDEYGCRLFFIRDIIFDLLNRLYTMESLLCLLFEISNEYI